MAKPYVTEASANFAEREGQVGSYSPELCFRFAKTHAAMGWSPVYRGEWDEEQRAAYDLGYAEYKK